MALLFVCLFLLLLCLILTVCMRKRMGLPPDRLSVTFIHPDLGIGGAERLILDAALGLRAIGHKVRIVTPYHDPARAFPETRDGTLDVVVHGNWMPRHIFGRGHVALATARMLWASAASLFLYSSSTDCFVIDQVTAPLVLIRAAFPLMRIPTVFYCHFPDQLCDASRDIPGGPAARSLVRRLYRVPFDLLEGFSLRSAHSVVFNSLYTRQTTVRLFPVAGQGIGTPSWGGSVVPPAPGVPPDDVLNPPCNTSFLASTQLPLTDLLPLSVGGIGSWPHASPLFVSINRFEGKKNLILALKAFLVWRRDESVAASVRLSAMLVFAGGYDPRLQENVAAWRQLELAAASAGVSDRVASAFNISNESKASLYRRATALLYTPAAEHFGIVPLEAMAAGTLTIAVNHAGPTETIVHGVTGYLAEPTPEAFAEAMSTVVVASATERRAMTVAAVARVEKHYSLSSFAKKFEQRIYAAFSAAGAPSSSLLVARQR